MRELRSELNRRRVFPALTGVGASAKAVHGHSQRLVCLGRKSAYGHAGRVESRKEFFFAFHLVQGQGWGCGLQRPQVTQG